MALKASFFEAVLAEPARVRAEPDLPLVGYVADEFHRFVTSDAVHGEQSFLDTCRSHGALLHPRNAIDAQHRPRTEPRRRRAGHERGGPRHPAGQYRDEVRLPLDRRRHRGAHRRAVPAPPGAQPRDRGPPARNPCAGRVLRLAGRRTLRAPTARARGPRAAADALARDCARTRRTRAWRISRSRVPRSRWRSPRRGRRRGTTRRRAARTRRGPPTTNVKAPTAASQ